LKPWRFIVGGYVDQLQKLTRSRGIVQKEETFVKNLAAKALVSTISVAMVVTPALAKPASELTFLNGQDAGSAQNQLEQSGFNVVSSHKSSMGFVNSYWWNGRDKNCVVVESKDGRVMTINDAKGSDCGHSGGNNATTAGAVVGLAILGAALASKSHHRGDTNYDERQTAEFDRGYKDGLYGAAYHNYNRQDAYAHGYEMGTDERNANLSHHHGQGGYRPAAEYQDLIGSRAAGGMDTLASRGFRQVDNFASGNARYSIQWRPQSRQCLQVIVANGRLENITDIQTHPNCR
jgi:hypothetical protein